MLQIAICDDEPFTVDYYSEQIQRILMSENAIFEITPFTDSGKLLSNLYKGMQWDLYFLDIDMPLVNGLSLGKKIREMNHECYIIYITIHREFVFDSFSVRPFRFIPKDNFSLEIEPCLKDLLKENERDSNKGFFVLETPNHIYRYPIRDILYVKSNDKYIVFFLVQHQETESIRFKFSDIETLLIPHGFIRIHKSYLINYRFVKNIQSTYLVLTNKEKLPISRYRLNDIKSAFRRLTL